MSKFIKTIGAFLGGVPLLMSKGMAAVPADYSALEILNEPDAIQLRPLNSATDNLFAGHRSHASHASHASHYSGAGSSKYVSPPPPVSTPQIPSQGGYPAVVPSSGLVPSPINEPTQRALAEPTLTKPTVSPVVSGTEKLTLQIIRVQIALTSLKFYDGRLDGVMSKETRSAIERFQVARGLPKSGLMTTPTLNALGVPAVN